MKKILSVLLALCMLASSCLLLASCDKVSEKKVAKDPITSISTALENSLSAFFTDDTGIKKVMDKAAQKGSYDITFASRQLLDGKLEEIREIFYADAKKGAYVSDTYVIYNDTEYNATVWADKTGIALKSEAILGNENTLRLVYETFVEGFEDSDLMAYIRDTEGLSTNEAADLSAAVIAIVENLRGTLDQKKALMTDKQKATLQKELCHALNQTVSTEEMTGINGKSAEHVVIEYVLDNEALADVCDLLVEAYERYELASAEEINDMKDALDGIVETLNSTGEMDFTVTFAINTKDYTLTTLELDGAMTALPEAEATQNIHLDVCLTFTKTAMLLNGTVERQGREYTLACQVAKTEADGKIVYDFDAAVDYSNISFKLLDATYTYDKESGDMKLQGRVATGVDSSADFELEANCEVTKSEATLELKSLVVSKDKVEIFKMDRRDELTVVIKAEDELPAMDKQAEDIVDMDTAEWEAMAEDFYESDLGKLFALISALYGMYSTPSLGV